MKMGVCQEDQHAGCQPYRHAVVFVVLLSAAFGNEVRPSDCKQQPSGRSLLQLQSNRDTSKTLTELEEKKKEEVYKEAESMIGSGALEDGSEGSEEASAHEEDEDVMGDGVTVDKYEKSGWEKNLDNFICMQWIVPGRSSLKEAPQCDGNLECCQEHQESLSNKVVVMKEGKCFGTSDSEVFSPDVKFPCFKTASPDTTVYTLNLALPTPNPTPAPIACSGKEAKFDKYCARKCDKKKKCKTGKNRKACDKKCIGCPCKKFRITYESGR